MKKIICYVLLACFMTVAAAASKEEADTAYARGQFDKALVLYTELLGKGENEALFYNIGNCYYRLDNMPRAVLYYEKALLLSPSDADALSNLQLAKSKTVDKVVPQSEMFFVSWARSASHWMDASQWKFCSLVAFFICGVCFLVFMFSNQVWVRKLSFFSALMLLLVSVLSNRVYAFQQRQLESRNQGIVMSPSVTVKSSPSDSGTDLFLIHAGTKVIVDDRLGQWVEVHLEDGKTGWMKKSDFEVI